MNKKQRKFRLFSLRTLLFVFVAVLIGFALYNWNAKKLTGNQMPMPFGYGVSVVLSGSMEDELSVNDLVLIRETQDVEVGDVVVYQDGRDLIIHRIIKMDGETVITQGDANNVADAPIRIGQIKGILQFKIPYVGAFVRLLQQPMVIILLTGLSIALDEFAIRREKQKKSEDLDAIEKEIKELIKDMDDQKENEGEVKQNHDQA